MSYLMIVLLESGGKNIRMFVLTWRRSLKNTIKPVQEKKHAENILSRVDKTKKTLVKTVSSD